MPKAGNFAAYKEAYRDKPIDVAGKAVETSQAIIDVYDKEQEEANQKKKDMENLYGTKVAEIYDTQDAPPSAQEISITAGDKIYDLIKNSDLEGIDLERAINNVIKDANHAITGITGAAQTKTQQPQDDFYKDGGFGQGSDEMLKGNLVFQYGNDGRGYFLGPDGPISVSDYNTALGSTAQIPQLDFSGVGENLNNLRIRNEWNLTTQEGQDAYRNAATNEITAAFNNPLAGTRYLYNNASQLGITDADKQKLLAIGQKLQSGTDLTDEEKTFYETQSQKGIDYQVAQQTQNLAAPKPITRTNRNTTTTNKVEANNRKTYISDTTKAYRTSVKDVKNLGEDFLREGVQEIIDLEDPDDIEDLEFANELGVTKIEWDDRDEGSEGHGKGYVTINGKRMRFEGNTANAGFTQLRNILKDAALRRQLGENYDIYKKYNDPTNVLEGDNYATISDDLNIAYDGQGVVFKETSNGITVSKGAKSVTLDLTNMSPIARKLLINRKIKSL